jgi:hypothetical protein
MSDQRIADGRSRDAGRKAAFYDVVETKAAEGPTKSQWRKFLDWLAS